LRHIRLSENQLLQRGKKTNIIGTIVIHPNVIAIGLHFDMTNHTPVSIERTTRRMRTHILPFLIPPAIENSNTGNPIIATNSPVNTAKSEENLPVRN
jgi:hypothetical protein